MRGLVLFLLLWPLVALAADYRFQDPAQEARFQAISDELRCLVCQGQSIAESNSELAEDLKREVARMIREGRSDAEIVDFMVARYGDFVLFKPPVKGATYLLWFGPFLLVAIGAVVLLRIARRRSPPPALTEAEREAAARLLRDEEEPRP